MTIIRATGPITNGDLAFFKAATVNGQNVLADITLESPTRWQLEFDDDGFPEEYELLITGENSSGGEVTRSRTYEKATVKVVGSDSDGGIAEGLNPAPGATLTRSSQQFTISGIGSSLWGITASTDPNDFVGSAAFFNSGPLVHALNAITLTEAPTNGQTIYVRSAIGDGVNPATQVIHEYTAHTAAAAPAPSPSPVSGLGPYPRLVPQVQGYALNSGPAMSLDNIVIADSHQELLNEIGSNKVVVPNFSGYRETTQEIQAGLSKLWIPGFMAPGEGFGFHVGGGDHNLMNVGGAVESVFQGFRLAPGTDGPDANIDPFRTESNTGAVKTVFDGMHLLWGRDQLCSIWYHSNNVLVKSSILGPTADNVSGRGPLVGNGSSEITFLQNLLPGGRERNPSIQGSHGSIINCMIIGWQGESLSFSNTSGRASGNIVGNIFENYNGNSGSRGDILLFNGLGSTAGFEIYIAGNIGNRQSNPDGDQLQLVGAVVQGGDYAPNLAQYRPPNTTFANSWVGGNPGVAVVPVSDLPDLIYSNVGPGPNRRDSKIRNIITRCQNGTMAPDASGPVSGLPSLASGASRIDTSRADLTTQEFRNLHGMPDNANGLVDTPTGSQWPWFFHFNHWNRMQN